MSKFFIAAGHGGTDPGAVSGNNIERNIAEATVDAAIKLCASQDKKGRELIVVPHALAFYDSINWINANITDVNNDMCMEVHLNSNAGDAGTGTETYHGYVSLATEVHEEVVKVLGLRDRGIKDGNQFAFNNSTKCGSCLIELGFVNNPTDVQAIIARGALALAKGIMRACNSTYVDPVIPPVVNPLQATVDKLTKDLATANKTISTLNTEIARLKSLPPVEVIKEVIKEVPIGYNDISIGELLSEAFKKLFHIK